MAEGDADLVTPSIDVVIPTFNRWELTKACLGSLVEQTLEHTVVLVDNGSTDGTPALVRKSFPEVRVIELGANLGFTLACNRGAGAGDGDIVVLLNNDVEPRPDFLEKLVLPFRDATVGSVAGLLVRPGKTRIDSMGLCADRTLAGFSRLHGELTAEASAERPVLAGPCGGGGAYLRTAWQHVGGLDEGIRFYGEDLDLALRIGSAGWKTAAAPDAVAVHHGSATAGHRSAWQRFEGGFARGYLLRRYRILKTAAGPRALATEAIVVVGDAILSRDLSALRGRRAGWHAAAGAASKPQPPQAAIDTGIGFRESIRLRREAYAE